MNIYQNLGVHDSEEGILLTGSFGLSYVITSAKKINKLEPPYCYPSEALLLECKQPGVEYGSCFQQTLVGKKVFKPFMKEMKVKTIEDLVGKTVLGFKSPRQSHIEGISVNHYW